MLLRQPTIFAAATALTIGGTVVLAEPLSHSPIRPNFPPSPSLAQAPGGWRNRQPRSSKFMEQLNLSDPQKQQLDAIRDKYQGQMSQLRQELRTKRQKLGDLMAGSASNQAIRQQHAQVTQLEQKLHNLRFESMLEMREVLTPEQRSQFVQLLDRRGEGGRRRGNP